MNSDEEGRFQYAQGILPHLKASDILPNPDGHLNARLIDRFNLDPAYDYLHDPMASALLVNAIEDLGGEVRAGISSTGLPRATVVFNGKGWVAAEETWGRALAVAALEAFLEKTRIHKYTCV